MMRNCQLSLLILLLMSLIQLYFESLLQAVARNWRKFGGRNEAQNNCCSHFNHLLFRPLALPRSPPNFVTRVLQGGFLNVSVVKFALRFRKGNRSWDEQAKKKVTVEICPLLRLMSRLAAEEYIISWKKGTSDDTVEPPSGCSRKIHFSQGKYSSACAEYTPIQPGRKKNNSEQQSNWPYQKVSLLQCSIF